MTDENRNPIVVMKDEMGVFAYAAAKALPGDAPVMIVVREGASTEDLLGAINAARATELTYGLPRTQGDLVRRWPDGCKGAATRVDALLDLGATDADVERASKRAEAQRNTKPAVFHVPESDQVARANQRAATQDMYDYEAKRNTQAAEDARKSPEAPRRTRTRHRDDAA